MPKSKPTQVIVHRIELQEKERDMLEAVVAGQTVKNVVVPVAIVGGVGSAAYISYKALKTAYDWGTDVVDDIQATPIGAYAESVYRTEGRTLPTGLRGFYKVVSWLTTPQK